MRISYWSSDVCSSDLRAQLDVDPRGRFVEDDDRRRMDHRLGDEQPALHAPRQRPRIGIALVRQMHRCEQLVRNPPLLRYPIEPRLILQRLIGGEEGIEDDRSEEHTSELQSLMRTS